jgi:methyl-accepting chemotaxis protein
VGAARAVATVARIDHPNLLVGQGMSLRTSEKLARRRVACGKDFAPYPSSGIFNFGGNTMFRLSNISIGIKLGLMSGLGILLVVTLLVGSIYTGSQVKNANSEATKQQTLALEFAEAKASVRGMMVGVRDVRLASSADAIANAMKYFEERRASGLKFIDAAMLGAAAENRARMEKMKTLVDQYTAAVKDIATLQAEAMGLNAKRTDANAVDTSARIAAIHDQASRIAKERTIPAGDEMQKLADAAVDMAGKRADAEVVRADQEMRNAQYLTISIASAVILILIGSAVFGAMTIARPLRALVKPLEDVAGGNFAITVPGTGRKDEVGQIAEAVQLMAQKVSSTIGEIKNSGREVTNASAEISTSTTDLSQRTEEQAASLEETSAAMEELSATVRKNAESAQQASQSASATRDVADRGGQVVAKTVEAMAKIEESSRKISDIIGVIDEIARQTNLLALNAAVEAARAGEAGRGFAVVASEVRSLAQRSSQAAKDIKDLITNSTVQVKEGVDLVNKAGTSLNEIVDSIKKVAEIVSDIANASIEQATGIDQINKALTQMDEVTQQNSALVEENAATAKTLEHQAKAMDDQVAFFQIGNDNDDASRAHDRNDKAAFRPKAAAPKRQAAKHQPVVQMKQTGAGNSGGPVKKMQTALATAVNSDDWKEF